MNNLFALFARIRALGAGWLAMSLVLLALPTAASAETLLMPSRDARTGTPVVVWGVHTQAAGTVCSLDFGDLTGAFNCTGVDRSYVAQAHTYASQGTYTIRLTVGAETTTTTIQVFNPAALVGGVNGDNNRSLGINMTIQDGLRFLWTSQTSRAANFPASTTTNWNNSGFPYADTSLVALAFENQGYKITANVPPTGIFEKYVVRRALNYVLSQLSTVNLAVTPGGNNPCVVYADCKGLVTPGDPGYTVALAILGFAGSGALNHVNTEVAGVTNGKTYGEVLQRLLNALAWGQNDSAGVAGGGWQYQLNSGSFDGSTFGWNVLALLDAAASGATVPAWVINEAKRGFNNALNTNGSFDYIGDGNAAGLNNVGPAKTGIGLQGLFLISEMAGVRVDAVKNNINSWWTGAGGIGGDVWGCQGANGNKGCGYTMFNNFKGLKLMGINTLPGVTRPAGPGIQPAGDWYADYQDWFVANQSNPTLPSGGNWSTMRFSSIATGDSMTAAIAELILSPVALVAPDPILFATVGLGPLSATVPIATATVPSSHTITAFAQAGNNAPVPGVTIDFRVLTGPNAGKTGTGTTGADGKTSFTYAGVVGGAGLDTIQAFIGTNLSSNKVLATWATACDLNGDGIVSTADLLLIRGRFNTVASGPTDPYDANRDGVINVADQRYCQVRRTSLTP